MKAVLAIEKVRNGYIVTNFGARNMDANAPSCNLWSELSIAYTWEDLMILIDTLIANGLNPSDGPIQKREEDKRKP